MATHEMMDPGWIGLQGWANDPNWILDRYQDYPRLAWEETAGQVIPEPTIDWIAGAGTTATPYEISEPNQLLTVSKASRFWSTNIVLMNDLDLSPTSWPQAVFPGFSGTFDGNGFAIKNLRIIGGNHVGFFGLLAEGGQVGKLGLLGANVMGSGDNVGGLVGTNRGDVANCHSSGDIAGGNHVGGLVGHNTGSVTGSHSAARISGVYCVGGLGGYSRGPISCCYSTGSVTGNSSVGGLVGCNDGAISCSYSVGRPKGTHLVGGLVAYSKFGSVSGSFWNIGTSGRTDSDGGTGLTTAEMWEVATYLEAGWDFVGEVENGVGHVWWMEDGRGYPRLWWEPPGIDLPGG